MLCDTGNTHDGVLQNYRVQKHMNILIAKSADNIWKICSANCKKKITPTRHDTKLCKHSSIAHTFVVFMMMYFKLSYTWKHWQLGQGTHIYGHTGICVCIEHLEILAYLFRMQLTKLFHAYYAAYKELIQSKHSLSATDTS